MYITAAPEFFSVMLTQEGAIYDQMDAGAAPMLPVYIIVATFTWILTLLLFRRWRLKRTAPAKWLLLAFVMYAFLITIMLVGFLEMYLTGYKMELYRFSLAAGYSGLMVANCCLLVFSSAIFEEMSPKVLRIFIGISIVIAVLVALPWNYYGTPSHLIPPELNWIRLVNSLIMMLFSVVTYSKIYKAASHTSRKVSDRFAKVGFRAIAWSQVSLIAFFVCILIDTALFSLFEDINGYTIFVMLAWGCVAAFYAFAYIGFIMPAWVRRLAGGPQRT
jgi:hypothetical protein